MTGRICLDWPHKSARPAQTAGGGWVLKSVEENDRKAIPFDVIDSCGGRPAWSLVLQGDRLSSVDSLNRTLGRSFKLAYLDLPRIEGYDETRAFRADDGRTWGSWLAVVRHHLIAARRLLARNGVLVVQGGSMEEAYARVLTDELFGPQNQLGSIVWQSHYSPKGGKLSSEIAGIHETLICVAQELDAVGTVALPQPAEGYSNPDGDPRGDWKAPQKDAGRDTVKLVYNLPPYRWELAKGRLPPGIWRISPFSGVIWGEPTQAGEWGFTVKVIDAEGRATTKSLSLTVDPDGGTEMPEGVWWMDHPPKPTKSKPRIRSARLPNGVVGRPYSVLLEASGGTPVLGQKRPRRGWGFGREKLIGAIVEDRCYFGRQGTAIPEPKRYLSALDEGVKYVNVTSWWPGTAVGWSQDATKHLRQLEEAGITSEVVETAKPEQLMARLIDAFTTPGDPVLEMFARAGDLSAVALKMGRPFVALAGGSELDRAVAERCCVPRLMGICSGEEGAALGETEGAIPIGPSAVRSFTFARLSAPLAVTDPMRDEFPRFLRENYKDPDSVAQAVLTCQGYVPTSTGGEFVVGALVGGRGSAVAVRPDVFLDRVLAAELTERVAPDEPGLTVFFFRSDEDLDPQEFPNTVNFRRVPMELGI